MFFFCIFDFSLSYSLSGHVVYSSQFSYIFDQMLFYYNCNTQRFFYLIYFLFPFKAAAGHLLYSIIFITFLLVNYSISRLVIIIIILFFFIDAISCHMQQAHVTSFQLNWNDKTYSHFNVHTSYNHQIINANSNTYSYSKCHFEQKIY